MPSLHASQLTLDDPTLERLFALWSIPLPAADLVLFALRGAVPLASSPATKGWARQATLALIEPDHIHMRCTVGIWNRRTGRLFAARGSTVPHRDNVLKAAARKGVMKGRGTNQLEPGYYTDLTKGEHLQGKPAGHAALRQTGSRFYRRAHLANDPHEKRGALYTPQDPLYFGNPYDNLHCAWNRDPEAAGFRSAGCLVVSGWPHSPRLPDAVPNAGAWKTFHDLVYASPQETLPLLLLPAEDAVRALAGEPTGARLVYGSAGEAVKALQKRLAKKGLYGGAVSGRLDAGTYRAWNAAGLR